MPWTPDDAQRHTHKATTVELKELWAKVANERLENTGDEGPCHPRSERCGRSTGGAQLVPWAAWPIAGPALAALGHSLVAIRKHTQ
jgi:hypothetical protein